jgi:hypothetical protein
MKRLFLAGALLVALLVPATASAAPFNPTGVWAKFNDCTLNKPQTILCLYSETTSGSLTIGSKTTPISKTPVVLQGGVTVNPATEELIFLGAEDGNTLTKVPQPVPGGLLGVTAPTWWPKFLQDLFNNTINNGFTGVTATMELAGPASSVHVNPAALIVQEGTALEMPVKVKLDNPFLGSSCYIGSNSSPIVLKLTTGTTSPPPPNKPISGSVKSVLPEPGSGGTIEKIDDAKLVDNSFSVPGANGCGGLFSFLIDPFVNSIVGIPSAAGKNTAILEGDQWLGAAEAVKASIP